METKVHELLIIGAGPGGNRAAVHASQLGVDVACVDKAQLPGGVCLRAGCIPSKVLLESSERFDVATRQLGLHGIHVDGVRLDLETMMERKDRIVAELADGIRSLFKKHGVTRYTGAASFEEPDLVRVTSEDTQFRIRAKKSLVVTGSEPTVPPNLPIDDERVGMSSAALGYANVPKRLAVIGAGYVGLELGSVWNRLGADVNVLESRDRILPGMDRAISKTAQKLFEGQGLSFRLQYNVTSLDTSNGQCIVHDQQGDAVEADRVLVAVGRQPNTEGLGLESIGVECDTKGFIGVNDDYETSCLNVYAVGDVIGEPMLAHKAEREAIICIERMNGRAGCVNYNAIPSVIYTDPEIAAVGRTEEQLQEEGVDYRHSKHPFRAVGRAKTLGKTDGFVKIMADAESDRVLGVHILGPRAGDLIAEAVAALEFGATSEDLALCCHAHPTLSEGIATAAHMLSKSR